MELKNNTKIETVAFREFKGIPSTTYATFALYQYPAKFIPQVVYYVLANYGKAGTKVFDPFAGYGTVGLASRLFGYDYELWDINPLLRYIHKTATMSLVKIDKEKILAELKSSGKTFIPDWKRMSYWFPGPVLQFLYRIWGYYNSLDEGDLKTLLTIPLLRTTRYFSYDDMQRQKLSKSKKSIERVETLLKKDWKEEFFMMLSREIDRVLKGISEYQSMNPKPVNATIKIGDTLTEELSEEKDLLITSPPYLQSQEYIRHAKMDLFWLGYTEKEVKELSKLELPYRKVEPFKVESETYRRYHDIIAEPKAQKIFEQYFWGVLGALTRLQAKISKYMFIFLGHASIRGHSVPLDVIFAEHFENYGWIHEKTLSDRIVSRRLFSYGVNPASKIKDPRTGVENLIILKRP